MTLSRKTLGLSVIALTLATGPTNAAEIKDDAEIFSRLLTTAVANEIREKCDSIVAREWRATLYVLGVVTYAKKQGFSMKQIEAYRNDPDEQARLAREGYAYLDAGGVDRAAGTGYCALGEKEIAEKSKIGRLLKSR
ncbi:MAG: DUF5333 domain-containing protein [Alphaproteobacteria bacterium]|nr:DUF5333 domain-containing protein [Alphaproteobacteria bacterium]